MYVLLHLKDIALILMQCLVGSHQYTNFTLHTPYSLYKIQEFFENKAMFNRSSPTGFKKWNPSTETMDVFSNIVNSVEKIPYEQGVPVMTILDYYDPNKNTGYIYPAFS